MTTFKASETPGSGAGEAAYSALRSARAPSGLACGASATRARITPHPLDRIALRPYNVTQTGFAPGKGPLAPIGDGDFDVRHQPDLHARPRVAVGHEHVRDLAAGWRRRADGRGDLRARRGPRGRLQHHRGRSPRHRRDDTAEHA